MCFIDPQRLVPFQCIRDYGRRSRIGLSAERSRVLLPRLPPGAPPQSFIVSEPSIISLPNPAPGFFTSPEIDSQIAPHSQRRAKKGGGKML